MVCLRSVVDETSRNLGEVFVFCVLPRNGHLSRTQIVLHRVKRVHSKSWLPIRRAPSLLVRVSSSRPATRSLLADPRNVAHNNTTNETHLPTVLLHRTHLCWPPLGLTTSYLGEPPHNSYQVGAERRSNPFPS